MESVHWPSIIHGSMIIEMTDSTGNSFKTSIIMTAFDFDCTHRLITVGALGNIQKYTDTDDYELILMDICPKCDMNTRHHTIRIDKHIKMSEDVGISKARNLGAKEADPSSEYFCFIDNDVFVYEGWLRKLRSYIESGRCDAVWPHQGPTSREFVLESYIKEGQGNDDAGCILITRKKFEETGGWDEDFVSFYHDKGFRDRMGKVGVRIMCTNQVIITHLGGITSFFQPNWEVKYNKEGESVEIKNLEKKKREVK